MNNQLEKIDAILAQASKDIKDVLDQAPPGDEELRIAAAAAILRTSIPAVRYYNKTGRLEAHRRGENGYRYFYRKDVQSLRDRLDAEAALATEGAVGTDHVGAEDSF